MTKKITGIVKWFNTKKGYGFITESETGKEYFVHYSRILTDGEFKKLDQGQKVEFVVETTKKGDMAVDVEVVK